MSQDYLEAFVLMSVEKDTLPFFDIAVCINRVAE